MLRHIVAWTFREAEGMTMDETVDEVVRLLEECRDRVPSVRELELGRATDGLEASYDLILVSTFDDEAGLQAYIKHPVHQNAVTFIGKVREQRVCMDYEV